VRLEEYNTKKGNQKKSPAERADKRRKKQNNLCRAARQRGLKSTTQKKAIKKNLPQNAQTSAENKIYFKFQEKMAYAFWVL
jgi:hypothetical protein